MKTIKSGNLAGMVLFGTLACASAQSTCNYVISDAGGGNSLLTWAVTGDLASPTGSVLLISESNVMLAINAPGIFADSFAANEAAQTLATPDGSYFQFGGAEVYLPIVSYLVNHAPGNGNDSFGLLTTPLPPRGDVGNEFSYHPGTQSALIPIAFSNFNPGTYQSETSEFDTPLTVNLVVVSAVPEPCNLSAGLAALLGSLLTINQFKPGRRTGRRQ
jgi:hypothetical protein